MKIQGDMNLVQGHSRQDKNYRKKPEFGKSLFLFCRCLLIGQPLS
jgi:hypothetical protein